MPSLRQCTVKPNSYAIHALGGDLSRLGKLLCAVAVAAWAVSESSALGQDAGAPDAGIDVPSANADETDAGLDGSAVAVEEPPGGAPTTEPPDVSEESGDNSDEALVDLEALDDDDDDEAPDRAPIRYFLEFIEVRGNQTTLPDVIRRYVPIAVGDLFDVDDPSIEVIRWRLLGTGWFTDVHLSLRRGAQRGWVVLVIEVEERNTLVIRHIAFGVAEEVARTGDGTTSLIPYGAISVAETNLLGLGMSLQLSLLGSEPQQAVRVSFADSMFLSTNYALRASALIANAREFFGDDDALVSITCPRDLPPEDCPEEVAAKHAVVLYDRYGWSLGTGNDLGAATWYTLDWHADIIDVGARPDAASELRGTETVPIDFGIDRDVSFVSALRLGIFYDRRDDPALPTEGTYASFQGDLGTTLLRSDYDFLRIQGLIRTWIPMPWGGHHLKLEAFGGVVFGRAPFFYRFYASDLSDLIPSRELEMSLDRRAPPNLFRTSIEEMRSEELAGRIGFEYGIPLHRGERGLRIVEAYAGAGIYGLADFRDLRVAIPGYDGLSRLPIDLTFDLGVRADTDVGVFQLGFSTLFGFVEPFND